jgi:hypothetical protein
MPTARPRHQVTETPDVARALDLAARRWPDEPRSKLLLRLVRSAGSALEEAEAETSRRRARAVETTSGKYADAFGDSYLADLRADWHE